MKRFPLAALCALALLAAGCGGSNDPAPAPADPPGGAGDPPPDPSGDPPDDPPPAPSDAVTGRVTYDFVPVGSFGGLDYTRTEARPVRGARVQYVSSGSVLAEGETDADGRYSLEVTGNQFGLVRVRAEALADDWHFRVLDNTDGNAIYTLDGAIAGSDAASVRDLHAPSGWDLTGYGGERAAAPFAILDTILLGKDTIRAAVPGTAFAPLDIHWSPDNVATFGEDGRPDPATGEIGSSQFAISPSLGMNGIYLLGAENADTEEYDRHVVLHEFAHYLEHAFSRSDSIGGPHALGDRLDMRVAYSEGLATAIAALALDDPVYRDTGGTRQAGAFSFNVEQGPAGEGWYSERSAQELIYDLFDTAVDGNDVVAFPLADLWATLTGPVRNSVALTSIFPFLHAVKDAHPTDQGTIDALAAEQGIDPVSTDFGVNETNDAGSPDVVPIYTDVAVNGPPVNLCSTNEFESGISGASNKLGSRRYLRLTPPSAGTITITMVATDVPDGEYADPDFIVHRQGPVAFANGAPSDVCELRSSPAWQPGSCTEQATISVPAAEHVVEIYEWTNTNAEDDEEFPPIGRTCFDVTVTQP